MKPPVLFLWDKDGTITGGAHLDASATHQETILPHVAATMRAARLNFVISGHQSPESESRDYDPDSVIRKFMALMAVLPIQAATFSPLRGGTACYLILHPDGQDFRVIKAHEDPRYLALVGKFKKPDAGMMVVLSDVARSVFNTPLAPETALFIGDTWHDEVTARAANIPFLAANAIHNGTHRFD